MEEKIFMDPVIEKLLWVVVIAQWLYLFCFALRNILLRTQ
jgi:hypothetical protein